jgi:hypothetical protein
MLGFDRQSYVCGAFRRMFFVTLGEMISIDRVDFVGIVGGI